MNKKKLFVLVLIIILVFAVILMSVVLINKYSEDKKLEDYKIEHDKGMEELSKIEKEEGEFLTVLDSRSDYFTIKNNINEYIKCVDLLKDNPTSENINGVYEKLDSEYIKFNNITKENLQEFYKNYEKNSQFYIDKVYIKDINQSVCTYIIYGRLIDKTNNSVNNYGFVMQTDKTNQTFSLILYDYMQKKELTNLTENEKINLQAKNSIKIKDYNTFVSKLYSEEEILTEYFKKFTNDLKYDKEHLYSILNSEYKEKRFESEQSFNAFIQKLAEEKPKLAKYSIDKKNNMYICEDRTGKYYIFYVKTTLDYTLAFDSYLIDSPQFKEKYDSSTVQEKVVLNIEKIKQAINSDDYNYVYSKLAQSFKDSKYKTKQQFEDYIKNAIYNRIKIEYKDFYNEGETYIYNIVINNLANEEDKDINMQVIMQLKENRDFIMSFSIK